MLSIGISTLVWSAKSTQVMPQDTSTMDVPRSTIDGTQGTRSTDQQLRDDHVTSTHNSGSFTTGNHVMEVTGSPGSGAETTDTVVDVDTDETKSDSGTSAFFSKFLHEFRMSGKRAIFLGIVERDAGESNPQFPVETSQIVDKSSLSFRASSGNTVARLIIDNRNDNKASKDAALEPRPEKSSSLSDILTGDRSKLVALGVPADDGNTYYKITEYIHQNSQVDTVSKSTTLTPGDSTVSQHTGMSFQDHMYESEDEQCNPKVVLIEDDGMYLPRSVPGVVCDSGCSTCTDGFTYRAVMYPMPTLRLHTQDIDRVYYETTRSVPVYCACLQDMTSSAEHTTAKSTDSTTTENDYEDFYSNFEKIDEDSDETLNLFGHYETKKPSKENISSETMDMYDLHSISQEQGRSSDVNTRTQTS